MRKLYLVLIVVLGGGGLWWLFYHHRDLAPIRVGVLHSLSGTMAISEKSVVDADLLAIEELNAKGGLLGRRIEPVITDGRSDWQVFANEAERLITEQKVCTIFGCWTSASRKMVKPVVERYNHLLVYPLQYEGLEESPNIFYAGAAPNQQIIPAIKWSLDHLGNRCFLVGSDYVFPRTANAIIRDQLTALRGDVAGEEYALLGQKDFSKIVQKIAEAKPNVIFNTINGDSNIAFFHALRNAGIRPDKIPTMSFSIAEDELRSMDIRDVEGDYAAWNYFQSIDDDTNQAFVHAFQRRYGAQRTTDDPMEAAYFSVKLWAQAVEDAGSDDVPAIRKAMKEQSLKAPEGIVCIDSATQHTWKMVRIGKITKTGQFEIVWSSGTPVRPSPYPIYHSKAEWDNFLDNLYQGWGQRWANPG